MIAGIISKNGVVVGIVSCDKILKIKIDRGEQCQKVHRSLIGNLKNVSNTICPQTKDLKNGKKTICEKLLRRLKSN